MLVRTWHPTLILYQIKLLVASLIISCGPKLFPIVLLSRHFAFSSLARLIFIASTPIGEEILIYEYTNVPLTKLSGKPGVGITNVNTRAHEAK